MSTTAVDWYQATISESSEVVRERLSREFTGTWEPSSPRWGYETGAVLLGPYGRVCEVLEGGRHGKPHVISSSSLANEFYQVIRDAWPEHNVSRMDVRVDVDSGPGTWERLLQANVEVMEAHGVKHYEAGDWVRGTAGRTIYLGATSSRARTRSYEKGKEREAAGVMPAPSPTWCRLEMQLRPQGQVKGVLAHLEPSAAWGTSPWAADLLQRVTGELVERVELLQLVDTPLTQSFRNCVRQYGPVLKRYAEANGGWAFLGHQVMDELERQGR